MYRVRSTSLKTGMVSVSRVYESREAAEKAASEEQRKMDAANAYFGTKVRIAVEVEEVALAICPKCGREYTGEPAISRTDNKTAICPECGIIEALDAYYASMNKMEAEA